MEKPPPLDPALVKAFVANAHGNLDKVKTLLAHEPGLLHAAWDWGGGDWETALGAAAHTGQRAIATFLLGCGARLDIFAAGMLGHADVVRAMLAAQPALRGALGPHGISLLAHAEAGGADARSVVAILREGRTESHKPDAQPSRTQDAAQRS